MTLAHLTTIGIQGSDARTYLQGQLSADLRKLTPQHAQLASCNSAQGRVQAIMTLVEYADGILAIVPTVMVERLLPRLRAYVLRAKVTVMHNTDYALVPWTTTQAAGFAATPLREAGGCAAHGAQKLLRWWSAEERYLLLTPRSAIAADSPIGADNSLESDACWRRADIAAGIPQVYPQTTESFVAQMLNLDLLGGISFDKGCYTGQEIIARTHYRGTIKRRMLRFSAKCVPPLPGVRLLCGTQHAGEVVSASAGAAHSRSDCELLAVVSLDVADRPLVLDGIADSALTRSPLPYPIPQLEAA